MRGRYDSRDEFDEYSERQESSRDVSRSRGRDARRYDDEYSRPSSDASRQGVKRWTPDIASEETERLPIPPKRSTPSRRDPSTPQATPRGWFSRRFPSKRVRRTIISFVVIFAILAVSAPIGAFIAYGKYQQLKTLALDGVHHLETVKGKLPTSTNSIATTLTPQLLASITPDVQAAQRDFTQLNSELQSSSLIAIAGDIPGLSDKITAARHLARAGVDITNLATTGLQVANLVLPVLHSSPITATTPIVTQVMLTDMSNALNTMEPLINDIAAQTQGISLGSLISASQQALLQKLIANLPLIHQDIDVAKQFLAFAPTFFSLKTPTTYLLLTLDHSELRAGGGFQGDYAYLTVQDGHLVGKLSLSDIYSLDDPNGACWDYNSVPPSQYSWWPFLCWGIRDSNVSADFPTTAKRVLSLLHDEGGQPVAGVIAMSPVIIEQILQITGPLHIGYDYNVDVTSTNLESLIHEFQLTLPGISAGNDLPPPDQFSSARKRFSGYLGQALQTSLHGLSTTNLVKIAQDAFDDIRSKDIQVYFSNQQIETFFTQRHLSSNINTSSGDGFFVVDSNAYGKQYTYIQENFHDAVQIDASGGATHTLRLMYNMVNPNNDPVYGSDFFNDYLRIYVPPQAKLVSSSNFDVTATTSDEPNRGMWAGWQIVYDNAGPKVMTVTWYVPHAVGGDGNYQLTVQRQAGTTMLSQQAKQLVVSAHITLSVSIFLPHVTTAAKTFVSNTGDSTSTWVKDAIYQTILHTK
jgi:hypothetical protein